MAELVNFSKSFKLNKPIPDDLVPILAKDEEKQKAIREKAERDAQSEKARAIAASTPALASRGPTGGKPVAKHVLPPSKTATNLEVTASSSSTQKPVAAAPSTSSSSLATKPEGTAPKKISMVIQPIPAFKGPKSKPTSTASTTSSTPVKAPASTSNGTPASRGSATPVSPSVAAANRLNVNAPSFRSKVRYLH